MKCENERQSEIKALPANRMFGSHARRMIRLAMMGADDFSTQ